VSLGRRKIALDDEGRWVFNRMADVYGARPAYPPALIDALVRLVDGELADGGRVIDVGAGIGHVALPLAERGLEVVAIEPALAMLERLTKTAEERGLSVRAVHATAEALPLPDHSAALIVIADALHFVDAELTAHEIARVLVPRGALAIVTCELGATPFMRALGRVMAESAPRRPRRVDAALAQLMSLTRVKPMPPQRFEDATPVDEATLEGILRSISFIGPAMSAERFATFRQRIHALPGPPVWTRTFTLHAARRALSGCRARRGWGRGRGG
jgi:SAM-dependent methyltransferase